MTGLPASPDERRARFEALALPHARSLYRTACRHLPADAAADVVQETFLRSYRTFDGFVAGSNEKAWLFTILYSIMSNRWRAERRAPEEVVIEDLDTRFASALDGSGPDAERVLMEQLGAAPEIQRALDALPDIYRAAVLLVDVEELTYEEASAALACPVGTVRSRLARGRRLLFIALTDYARALRLLPGEPS